MQENRKREIRIAADGFREKCKTGRYGIIDLFNDCERMDYKLFRYPLGSDADLGFSLKRDNDIIIFTNTSSRLSREIFTLAHELGHVVLHFVEKNTFTDNNSTITDKTTDIKEQEANYFAACLLMPEASIKRFLDLEIPEFLESGLSSMDIARIMIEFKVSFDMALNRLENLSLISPAQRLCLDTEKTEKRVGNLLLSAGDDSKLNISSQEISIPYEYIEYAIYNYNNKVIPKETLEKVLGYYQLGMEDVGDKLIQHNEERDENLDDLIGGLKD